MQAGGEGGIRTPEPRGPGYGFPSKVPRWLPCILARPIPSPFTLQITHIGVVACPCASCRIRPGGDKVGTTFGEPAADLCPQSVPSESLFDGSGKRLGDVCAAPGERRPRVDAEPGEDAGERLRLKEGARDLFVGAGAGAGSRVNDRPRRGALRLGAQRRQPQRPSGPGSLHTAGCIAVARRRPVRTATDPLGRTTRREGSSSLLMPQWWPMRHRNPQYSNSCTM